MLSVVQSKQNRPSSHHLLSWKYASHLLPSLTSIYTIISFLLTCGSLWDRGSWLCSFTTWWGLVISSMINQSINQSCIITKTNVPKCFTTTTILTDRKAEKGQHKTRGCGNQMLPRVCLWHTNMGSHLTAISNAYHAHDWQKDFCLYTSMI